MGACGLDAVVGRDSLEFDCTKRAMVRSDHMVHPIERGACAWIFIADPVPHLGMDGVHGWVARDTGDNDFSATFAGCVEIHP